jgi:ketosteroid isomerase-like protein
MNPLAADANFFNALIKADIPALDRILADDFVLIDVMGGSEISKTALLAALDSNQVEFEAIEPTENRVRLYHATAVVTGRTQMQGRLAGSPFGLSSRYTHVYVQQQGEWRLVTAQGTQIPPLPGEGKA